MLNLKLLRILYILALYSLIYYLCLHILLVKMIYTELYVRIYAQKNAIYVPVFHR